MTQPQPAICADCGKLPRYFLLAWFARGICEDCYAQKMRPLVEATS